MLKLPPKSLIKNQSEIQLFRGLYTFPDLLASWLVTSAWAIQTFATTEALCTHFGEKWEGSFRITKSFWGDLVDPKELNGYVQAHLSKWTYEGHAFLTSHSGKHYAFAKTKYLNAMLRATSQECGQYGAKLWVKKPNDPIFLTSGEFHQASIVAIVAPMAGTECTCNLQKDKYARPIDALRQKKP